MDNVIITIELWNEKNCRNKFILANTLFLGSTIELNLKRLQLGPDVI